MIDRPSVLPELSGHRVTLRAPRPEDIADRLEAGRDAEFRRMVGAIEARGPLTHSDAERWYATLTEEPHGWVIEHAGRCIGTARLFQVDAGSPQAHLALGIFAPEHRGRGLGTEVITLLLAYAFGARAQGVQVRVLAFNTRALACYARCGFREVGREPVVLGDEATEDILLRVAASDFAAAQSRMNGHASRPAG